MKILIVEDEDSLREVMIRSLEKERYVVESAANYQDALLKINVMITIVSCWISCCRAVAASVYWKN